MTENEADSLSAALDRFGATALAIKAERDRMEAALEECEEYFDRHADAEYFTDSPSPVGNEEMHMLVAVRTALGKAP